MIRGKPFIVSHKSIQHRNVQELGRGRKCSTHIKKKLLFYFQDQSLPFKGLIFIISFVSICIEYWSCVNECHMYVEVLRG